MPPARISRQTSTTTLGATNSRRNGSRRENFIDQATTDEPGSADENEEPAASQSSQSQDSEALVRYIGTIMKDQSRRQAVRRARVLKSYNQKQSQTLNRISSLFDQHESVCDAIHARHMSRLKKLIARKQEIEKRVAEKRRVLREAYVAHSMDLEAVVEARARALE